MSSAAYAPYLEENLCFEEVRLDAFPVTALMDLDLASIVEAPLVRFDTWGRRYNNRPAPKLASSAPYDPYKFDVFNAGVMINGFSEDHAVAAGLPGGVRLFPMMEQFKALVSKMTAPDPNLRPTALDSLRELSAFSCLERKAIDGLQQSLEIGGTTELAVLDPNPCETDKHGYHRP
ncbi:hypothetical protein DFJ73DRAFT_801053 [Zopfochytrium polystomum]|nr:hypothetical protein DFJ73DRAFT_801053 [Zopfochytrium polystomum]